MKKRNALNAMATIIGGVTGVTTCAVADSEGQKWRFNILRAQLPYVRIIPSNEVVTYQAGVMSKNVIHGVFRILVISWDGAFTDVDIAEAGIRDAFGDNVMVNTTLSDISFGDIVHRDEPFPLLGRDLPFRGYYETNIKNV